MSDAVWSEQRTSPEAIDNALRELVHRRHGEEGGLVPARALNMVAFVDRQYSGEIANRLRGVGRYHASRLIVLAYEPRREQLDARVTVASEDQRRPGELGLLHETVVVELGAAHMDDLPTIVDPLVVTDLPTLLWSPHGHMEAVEALSPLAQSVLIDSASEPVWREALDDACALTEQLSVVDLAWLRSAPWRERVAAAFSRPARRAELETIAKLTIRHHADYTVSAMLLAGWLASRLGWQVAPLVAHGGARPSVSGRARARRQDVTLRLEALAEQPVPGLDGVTLETASGRSLTLERGPGGLHAREQLPRGELREWLILGASRGEGGILGEGIRQALLPDPTYVPALRASRAMVA
jgi:glucose-6-phosphate dehydrogenase assembly protein OpcA